MSVYKRGDVWWYKFRFANRPIRESAKTQSKTVARDAEKKRRRELEEGYNDIADNREERVQPVAVVGATYLEDYKLKHRAGAFAEYAIGHVARHLGRKMVVDVGDDGERWALPPEYADDVHDDQMVGAFGLFVIRPCRVPRA